MDCDELREEEWQVLTSIYPDFVHKRSGLDIFLNIPVEFDSPRRFVLYGYDDDKCPTEVSLTVLPSVMLHILLPNDYPTRCPPQVISIQSLWIGSHWRKLQLVLSRMWQSNCVIYDWVEFLRNGESITDCLGFLSTSEDAIRILHPAPTALARVLVDNESDIRAQRFSSESYQCSICLEYTKGFKCLKLSCGDTFCRTCLESFWQMLIKEGDVARVGCPSEQCVKARNEASEEEVARVVNDEELRRWRWLKGKLLIERDPSIILCPLSFCQKPVAMPLDPSDRLRVCSCSYSFCALCKRTWHGPVSACPTSISETLVLEYLAQPENSQARALMERRYGRANVLRLVASYQEEQLNEEWFEASTSSCPGCNIRVEKSLGCNHMTCSKCSTHFCYRCGERLSPKSPYVHFTTPGVECYGRLFDEKIERIV